MQLIKVFPQRTSYTPTDALAFIGDPPFRSLLPEQATVHISCTFTRDISEAQRLAAAWSQYFPTQLGGPAFSSPCSDFTPGQYVKPGVTFTTRGCNNQCPWCLVHQREGTLTEIKDFAPGFILQDNNILQASPAHIERVFSMLKAQHRQVILAGGLDSTLITDQIANAIKSLPLDYLFLAADTKAALHPLEKAIRRLSPLPRRKIRVYALLGFNSDTISDAEERLETIWNLGGLPFAQLYQPPTGMRNYSQEWHLLTRKWSRPAAMFASHPPVL